MKTPVTALSILTLAMGFSLIALPDAAFGGAPATAKTCQECHGKDGVSMRDAVPTIAGISMFVHADYLYAFRDGARACVDSESKETCSTKAKLSDEQIEDLAEYFAGIEFKAATQKFDADKAALGAGIHAESCAKCHTDGGGNPDDDSSILAGQWLAYLQKSMSQFVSESREQPKGMQRKMVGLSEADVEALAHYYASQQ